MGTFDQVQNEEGEEKTVWNRAVNSTIIASGATNQGENMQEPVLIGNIWFTLVLWGLTYIADYYLTIYGAKKYQEGLSEVIQHEGSYELTPQFQDDINNLRLFSPGFIWRWVLSLLAVYAAWWLSNQPNNLPWFYYFITGSLLLRGFAVLIKHISIIITYRLTQKGGLTGSIHHQRWLSLQLAAGYLFRFGLLYLVLGILFGSWFFFGGTFGCWLSAFKYWKLGSRASKSDHKVTDNE